MTRLPSSIERLQQQIGLFERALTQHLAAERHWHSLGNHVQTDLAQVRQAFTVERLAELRTELKVAQAAG